VAESSRIDVVHDLFSLLYGACTKVKKAK